MIEESDFSKAKFLNLDSAAAILSFAKGKQRVSLDKNRLFQSAVLRELEIIGEAAGRVSKTTQKKFPHIPWKELVGLRNRLIHAYFDVDHDIVWKTIREYIPSFYEQLKEVVDSFHS